MSLTPERLADGALGTGYALPAAKGGPTLASVLASMSPQTRQYTKAIMRLPSRNSPPEQPGIRDLRPTRRGDVPLSPPGCG